MSTSTASHEEHPPRVRQIEVKVTTSLSVVDPYLDDYPPETVVSTIRVAAMEHFGIEPDPNYDYYLVHERQRVADTASLEELVGKKHKAAFRLAKEIKQG